MVAQSYQEAKRSQGKASTNGGDVYGCHPARGVRRQGGTLLTILGSARF
jgi:hypothetical protein